MRRSWVLLSLALSLFVAFPNEAAEPRAPFSVTIPGAVIPLPYRVKDAEFSTALNSIISVSDSPAQLHLHDPATSDHFHVNLPLAPNCVSVSPDGLQAVVGHNAWISVIDLSTRALIKTVPVSANVTDVVHGIGYAYAFGDDYLRTINLTTDAETSTFQWRRMASARLHPALDRIYGADRYVSPGDISRYDIAGGPVTANYDSPYHGDYSVCGDVWIVNDGMRLVTACGDTFRASNHRRSDMEFAGTLSEETRITWAAQAGGSLLVLPTYSGSGIRKDTEVHFYTPDAFYRGKAQLPSFVAEGKTSPSSGRWIFSNGAETRQYVIVQADASSGIVADYGVVTIDCTAAATTLAPVDKTISAVAQQVEIEVSRDAACGWEAVSSASWIQTTSGGVGNGTAVLNVAANETASARTGTVVIGGATFTLTQDPAPAPPPAARELVALPFRVIDAEFSKQLDAVIAVSESPNALRIYNPVTRSLRSVALGASPLSVSVGPTGLYAAVGHRGTISYVDLLNATLVKTLDVSTDVLDIVLAGNGYVYAFPQADQWESIRSVHIASNTETHSTGNSIYAGTLARLHPGGTWIYGADNGLSPSDIEKYGIASGNAVVLYDSPYHGDYSMCGNLWFSEDGTRIYTACGNVFRATDSMATDMTYAGSLENATAIQWASNSQAAGWIAVVPRHPYIWWDTTVRYDHEIRYFTQDFLASRGKFVLPSFVVENEAWQVRGRWHFYDASGVRQYIVTRADAESGLLYDYGVLKIDCEGASQSLDSTGSTIGSSGGNLSAVVTATEACGWKAISNVSWINTLSSAVGNGTLHVTVSANPTVATRTGTVTLGSAVYTVQQAGAAVTSVVATATSTTAVAISWAFAGSAAHYEVWRTSATGTTLIGSPTHPSFTDTTATADTTYIYKVRAVMADASMSQFASDYAHTFTYTDASLLQAPIRAVHLTELRTIVSALLQHAGHQGVSFTDPGPLNGVTAKRLHITDLRDGIAALRATLGLPPLLFSALPPSSTIRASATEELRTALR